MPAHKIKSENNYIKSLKGLDTICTNLYGFYYQNKYFHIKSSKKCNPNFEYLFKTCNVRAVCLKNLGTTKKYHL